ncbi:MAG: NUDIX domain-containing protein [Lewinellaceae bacterium]|nr:NUDIX domain-containing protein [Lewinellaceae bacterium]
MGKQSAGILLFRKRNEVPEFLLVHPGGPYWAKKDRGAWSIPKGEFTEGEVPIEVAKREFQEETGTAVQGNFIKLTPQKLKSRKMIHAWAVEGDFEPQSLKSNDFEMEWPPKSGRKQRFPEVDRAGWFPPLEALQKINAGQIGFIEELVEIMGWAAPRP